jgi:hypothetical protein
MPGHSEIAGDRKVFVNVFVQLRIAGSRLPVLRSHVDENVAACQRDLETPP